MSGLVEFARNELNKLLDKCDDSEAFELQQEMNKDILAVVETFASAGHTGFTASYTLGILNKLLNWKPISPLTGDDSEWKKLNMDESLCYQNLRCPAVFKDKDGRAYYTEARIFSSDNGHTWFTSKESTQYIEFPFTVPQHSEQVILDTKHERQEILNKLVEMLENICNNSIKDIDEDTKVLDIISEDKIEQFEKLVVDSFKLSKPSYGLTDCEKFWEIINYVISFMGE